MVWNGKCNGTEISVWNMEDAKIEWNGIFQNWNGRISSILPYQSHTRFCVLYLQKNTYRCRVVTYNIVTEVFNFNIYAYYLSTNRGTLVVCIAQTVYVLPHCKYIAICSIDVTVDNFDRLDLFFFEIDNLPSPRFRFLTSSRKLIFAISFPFQLTFIYIFSFSAYNNSFWSKSLVFLLDYYGKCSLAVWL